MPDFKELIDRITINEGYRESVYQCTAGYDTVGIGFALKDLEFTPDEAYGILLWQISNGTITMGIDDSKLKLAKKIGSLHLSLAKRFDWYDSMPAEVQGVIIEMCYQLGITGFSKFKKAIAHMKESEWRLASAEMLDSLWAIQTPNRAKQLAGIVAEHG